MFEKPKALKLAVKVNTCDCYDHGESAGLVPVIRLWDQVPLYHRQPRHNVSH